MQFFPSIFGGGGALNFNPQPDPNPRAGAFSYPHTEGINLLINQTNRQTDRGDASPPPLEKESLFI